MWLILLFQDSLHRQAVKPSFVAPSQPLEKSLKEHIQKTAGLADWETGETRGKEETKAGKKAGHKRDKKKKATMAAAPTSKESSPSDSRKSTSSK